MSSSSASSVAYVNANNLIKDAMAKMPDILNTKKEIDEYYKNMMKEINEKLKEEKKANKDVKKAEPKKRVKKVKEVDEDGNEIVKVKKPLNNYQKFIQEQRPKVKEDYPDMSGEEIFTKIAELWKIHKENMKSDEDTKKSDSDDDKKSDSEDDDKKSDSDDITVVEDKKEDKKKEKKEKPEKKEKKEVAK
jgi:hypothetical protein